MPLYKEQFCTAILANTSNETTPPLLTLYCSVGNTTQKVPVTDHSDVTPGCVTITDDINSTSDWTATQYCCTKLLTLLLV